VFPILGVYQQVTCCFSQPLPSDFLPIGFLEVPMSLNNKISGFTLVEVAIVLIIVGLLLAGGINLMSFSADTAKYKESQNNLNDIKEALISYYTVNHFLPCPDMDGDGIENPPTHTGTCTYVRGFLPHVTLGIGGSGDAWGERIKYVVSPIFTAQAATNFCSVYSRIAANQITVQDLQATAATLGDWAAFALVSTGKNGRQTNSGMTGAFTDDGGCATVATDINGTQLERENCDADSILRFGNQMTDGATVTFDDMVVWVGDMQLISELRKSGCP
jgi:prepilin-type N-terminal cleavage/methylation domain-containing protein